MQVNKFLKFIQNDMFILTISMTLLYFITGKISFYFSLENSIVTICIFFAEGISLVSAMIFGKRAILGVFIGQFLLAFDGGLGIFSSLGISTINSIELVIALYIFKKYNFDMRLLKLRDLNILFITIIFVLQPFSSFFGNIVLLSSSVIDISDYPMSLFSWWFGNTMGQLLIVPMILAIYNNIENTTISKIIWIVILFVTLNYSFIILLHIENIALLFSFMIPLVLLVSRYDGLYYAGISIFIIALTSLYSAKIGVGIFSNDTMQNNLININFYILAHIVILYTHGVSIAEKETVANKIKELNQHLSERIKDEVEKNMKKDRLMMQQSRLAQMGEAISMIAHQWRQPLNTLSLITEGIYIKFIMGKLDQDGMDQFKQSTQKQIKQMSNTIDDFRDFFKPKKEKEVFGVDKPIKHVLTILDHMLRQESIEIETYIDEKLYIEGYPNELGQVLVNVINNAKDALRDIPNETPKTIKIKSYQEDDKIFISLEDNASGIPDDIIEKIFDPYFSTKTEKNGTGLGLYMSKMIIEDHMQGSLDVYNSEEGAKFVLSFPIHDSSKLTQI